MMGGSSAPTNTTTTTQLSPAQQAMVNNTYGKADQTAGTLGILGPYNGQMVAPLNNTEENAANFMSSIGQYRTGDSAIVQGINDATTAANYTPQNVSSGTFTGNNVSQYMNPYTQNVINTTNQQVENNLAQTNQTSDAQATSAGAYGGTRAAVQTAQNNNLANQTMAQTDAALEDSAYNNAQQQFNTSNAASLQAQEANQAAGIQGANLGLGASDLLGQLGTQRGSLAENEAEGEYNAGAIAQNQQNQQNAWNYQQNYYNPYIEYPQMALQDLEGSASIGDGGTSTLSQPNYSNPMMGALGGMAAGGAMGSTFGPWGTAIGVVGGGLMGAFG